MSKNHNTSTTLFDQAEAILRCPLCRNSMKLVDGKSLVCTERHCYDLAKQGYVNLLTHGIKTKYDKQLFAARKALAQSGFFAPLNEQVSEMITTYIDTPHRTLRILDAGCGEGSHLASIQQTVGEKLRDRYDKAPDVAAGADHLKANNDYGQLKVDSSGKRMDEIAPARAGGNLVGVGVDIAKEGIILAARDHNDIFWCVADLAKCPFADQSFEVILNILSPANYAEFTRVLTEDGLIIKVIPEKDYLKELRTLFYEGSREAYSNANTLELFANQLELLKVVPVQYQVTLDRPLIEHLVHMTPLTWGAKEEQVAKALELDNLKITVDFAVMIGRKNAIY